MLGRRVLVAALMVSLSGCAWAQYRGDAEHTGYQPFESTIGVSNVSSLAESWSIPNVNGSGVVAGGILYAPSVAGLEALDAAGLDGCGGSPKTCSPLWTGLAPSGTSVGSTPAVANGIVYVNSSLALLAFDAAGVNGCSGVPKTCTPLWSATIDYGSPFMSPTVANGVVYVANNGGSLYAFDAAGIDGCSGAPKTCTPLWTGLDPNGSYGTPTVANGVVYLGGLYQVEAFDAAGVQGCSGAPKICAPLWTGRPAPRASLAIAVANGVVYASGTGTTTLGEFEAFDAAGVDGCSGVPKVCLPLWTAKPNEFLGPPAVAGETVFATTSEGTLYAYDATGITGCSGSPKACAPKWTAYLYSVGGWPPSVANGVVYSPTFNKLVAYDTTGTGCPAGCQPLWVSPQFKAGLVDPFVVNGTVFVYSQDGTIHALRLPAN